MKKVILLAIVVVAGLAILGYFRSVGPKKETAAENKEPRIVVEPPAWDFGTIARPAVATHDFVIKNTGQEDLKINQVSTSCGCTTAKVDRQKIEPGQTATLSVRYDSGAMAHEKDDIERMVYLKTNDPEKPQVEVRITARVL